MMMMIQEELADSIFDYWVQMSNEHSTESIVEVDNSIMQFQAFIPCWSLMVL
jgi:hypothetical protein